MVNIYGKHFIYDGRRSRLNNLVFANVETSPFTAISGEKKGKFVFNKAMKYNHLVGDDYTDSPISFEVDIVTCDGRALTYQEIRDIDRWLFVNSTYKKLYIDPEDDEFGETYELVYGAQKSLYFNCRFLHAEKLEYNNGVVGFRCTLETDSMMMWQDKCGTTFDFSEPIYGEIEGKQVRMLRGDVDFDGQLTARDSEIVLNAWGHILVGLPSGLTPEQEAVADMDDDEQITAIDAQMILKIFAYDITGYPSEPAYITIDDHQQQLPEGTKIVTVKVDSDIDGYTYPMVTLWVGSTGGDVTLVNYNDDENRQTKFTNLSARSRIVIDSSVSRIGILTSDDELDMSSSVALYQKMSVKNFPRLVEGLNQIRVDGDVLRVDITWNNRRLL